MTARRRKGGGASRAGQGRPAAAASPRAAQTELVKSLLSAVWLKRAAVAGAWAWSGWVGLVQLMHGGRYLNPDGVSYLDLGRTLLSRWMLDGYSGYWSPLYAVLVAAGAQAAEWAGRHRLAGVQAVNLGLFLAALAACAWMVRKFVGSCGGDPDSWRAAGLQAAAMALFTVLVVRFGGLPMVTPDLLVAGLTMAAAGLTAELASGEWSRRRLLAAGLLMGLGYWAKAIFFPLWWWWLALAIWLGWRRPGGTKAIVWALAGWLVLAAPLVALTSRAVGRLSFGEVGRLSVLWYVNRVAPFAFWEGREQGYGSPVHPLRKLAEQPAVYAFGDVFPEATYPLWYAPWFWYEGAEAKVSLAQVADALRVNWGFLREPLTDPQVWPMMILSLPGWLFAFAGGAWRPRLAALLLASGPFALLFVHADMRFFYGNVTAAWAAGAAGLAAESRGWRLMLAGMLVLLCAWAGLRAWRGAMPAAQAAGPYPIAFVADELRRMGVEQGTRTCWIGSVPGAGELAWELKGRIVAQIRDTEYSGWMQQHGRLPSETEAAFRRAGCQAAVAMLGDKDPPPQGWAKAGQWPVYMKRLD